MKKEPFYSLFTFFLMVVSLGEYTASARDFTPETLLSLYSISAVELSPDGSHYIYQRSLPSISENSSSREVCLGTLSDTSSRVLLSSDLGASSAVFLDDRTVVYLSREGGTSQVWLTTLGGERRQLSRFGFDVTGFLFSPDRRRVLLIRDVALPSILKQTYPDLDKSTGRIVDDLMYKHWDEWVSSVPKPFIASVGEDFEISMDLTPVLGEDEWYEAPTKPFGGVEQFAWSRDSRLLAYSCRKKMGMDYAVSTNTDIYLFDLQTGLTRNLTEGMLGYDTAPAFSPDGKYLSWGSMERDGYEADLNRLFVMDLATGKKSWLSEGYENNLGTYQWAEDSKSIRFITNDQGLYNLFSIDLKSRQVSPLLLPSDVDVKGFSGGGHTLVCAVQSMQRPTDLYLLELPKRGRKPQALKKKLTSENDELLSQIPEIKVQKRWIKTTDGKEMLTWVILPPDFDPTKKYPAILYCQGGPQSTVSQFWSTRWNFRTFASHGYIIVAPNRRGVPGFGVEWNEQISGDYGGQNMKDYLSAIDALKEDAYVDENRLGAMGASYGGFSVYWLAGHHEGRFKALFAHAGIFNLPAQYLETEEKFFANWDMGGPYWDKSNKIAQRTYASSPHLFVENWTAPLLISHGELDYRILASQGMMAFDAAKMRGLPARMVIYPDENHWILKPQNTILFYRTFFDWMDRYLR